MDTRRATLAQWLESLPGKQVVVSSILTGSFLGRENNGSRR